MRDDPVSHSKVTNANKETKHSVSFALVSFGFYCLLCHPAYGQTLMLCRDDELELAVNVLSWTQQTNELVPGIYCRDPLKTRPLLGLFLVNDVPYQRCIYPTPRIFFFPSLGRHSHSHSLWRDNFTRMYGVCTIVLCTCEVNNTWSILHSGTYDRICSQFPLWVFAILDPRITTTCSLITTTIN